MASIESTSKSPSRPASSEPEEEDQRGESPSPDAQPPASRGEDDHSGDDHDEEVDSITTAGYRRPGPRYGPLTLSQARRMSKRASRNELHSQHSEDGRRQGLAPAEQQQKQQQKKKKRAPTKTLESEPDNKSFPARSQSRSSWMDQKEGQQEKGQLAVRGKGQRGGRGDQQLQKRPSRAPSRRGGNEVGEGEESKPAEKKGGNDGMSLRLDLNLEIEITLKARIHGDLTLSLFN